MNFFSAIIDSIVGFVNRNPLTTIIIVMLLVFAPSFFGALLIGVAILILITLAIPLFMLFRLRRMGRKIEDEARQNTQHRGFYGNTQQRGFHNKTTSEGDVKVHSTTQQPPKRVNDDVGDYVEFEEVKDKK